MRDIDTDIVAALQAGEIRPVLLLDCEVDGTHYRYTDADVPVGEAMRTETITGGPAVHGLSLADGAAFCRLEGLDLSPYRDSGYLLTLADASGDTATGYIGAADAAEALGSELVTNGGFASDATGWTAVPAGGPAALASVAGGQDGNCLQITENGGQNPGCYQAVTTVAGKLYKLTAYIKAGTEATYNLAVRNGSGDWIVDDYQDEATGDWVQHALYFTAVSTSTRVYLYQIASAAAGTTLLYDTVSLKEVTDGGMDGVHIVSTGGGSTRNWASIGGSFDYNDDEYTATISGSRFEPRGARLEAAKYSLNKVVDSLRIELDNLDDALTAAFAGGTPQGGEVSLKQALLNSDNQVIGAPVTWFQGEIDEWSLTEEKVSFTVASELVRWNQRTLAKHSASCRWKEFKGTRCAYAGAETWCDRTYTRCAALGNQANFGGFRWLPSIMEKEIWWGRTRAV